MGIKHNPETNSFEVTYSARHPVTRKPKGARRILNDRGEPIRSKAEAQRIYTELAIKVRKAFEESTATKVILYAQLLNEFLKVLLTMDFTTKTVENYSLCLNAHTMELWGKRAIDSITSDEIRHLIKVKLANRSTHQQKNVRKYLNAVFNYAAEKGYLQRNPVPKMQFRHGDKIQTVLTEIQLKFFLEKALEHKHEWYPIWAGAVYTGCRNGELIDLTWDKVDLENRRILISSTWNHIDGHKNLTKSGEDRIIEIAPPLLSILKDLQVKSYDSVYVFPRISDWDEGRQAEILRRFLLGINLPPVRFHDLRASWATVMLSKGIEPVKVMNMGGWKDLKTMMIYVRKAGINIKGITDNLILHDTSIKEGKLLSLTLEK